VPHPAELSDDREHVNVKREDVQDLSVIGAGAAGLATAIFSARNSARRIVCLDTARLIGAKILISGGSRCNVTNRSVTERDFWGGSSRFVRNILRAFPESRAVEFFAALGVTLHEEEDGKLFPDSNTSRTVLNALMREADRLGIGLMTGERVHSIVKDGDVFLATTDTGRTITSRCVPAVDRCRRQGATALATSWRDALATAVSTPFPRWRHCCLTAGRSLPVSPIRPRSRYASMDATK